MGFEDAFSADFSITADTSWADFSTTTGRLGLDLGKRVFSTAATEMFSVKKSGERSWLVVSRRLAKMVKLMRDSIPSDARSV